MKGEIMTDRDAYLEDKHDRIDRWIGQLARLDALCREAGEDVRIQFEVQLEEFSRQLRELQTMFLEFENLNEESRDKFSHLVEKNWNELEESYKASVSQFESLHRGAAGE